MTQTVMAHTESAGARVFRASLAFFIALAVARIPDIVPYLASLHPSKLLTVPMLLTAAFALPRWQLMFALRTTTARAVGVIAVLSALSVPTSIWPTNSAVLVTGSFFPALVMYLLSSAGFADRQTARICVFVFVLAVAADAAYVLVGPAPEKMGRPYIGESLDPNESAALFVTTFPFAMLLASERKRRQRWFGFGVAILLAIATMRTGSRGGIVGLVVVAAALLFAARSRRRWVFVIGIAACIAAIAWAADQSSRARLGTLLSPTADYNYTDREGRLQIWGRGLQYMLKRPIFGVGLGNFEIAEGVLSEKARQSSGIRYTAPHNAFIQIGAELGVVGLGAFVVAIVSAARGCRRVLRRGSEEFDSTVAESEVNLATAAFCALLGIITTALFLSLAYSTITVFVLAVCTGVQAGSPYARRPAKAPVGWTNRFVLARS